ncbi:MAG: hypothetical protein ACFFCS_23295 [Candidatus Hodarchaeota archaeon]
MTIYTAKVTMCGLPRSGQQSLVRCLVKHEFDPDWHPFIGSNFAIKELELKDGGSFHMYPTNLAGNPYFKKLRGYYSHGSNAFILLYDITDTASFKAIESFHEEFKGYAPEEPCYIMGTKRDLQDEREVPRERLVQSGRKLRAKTWEVSARTGENVYEAFADIALDIIREKEPVLPLQGVVIPQNLVIREVRRRKSVRDNLVVHSAKVVFSGLPAVGKRSLMGHYLGKKFDPVNHGQLGIDFHSVEIPRVGAKMILYPWYMPAREPVEIYGPRYAKGASMLLFVYDVSNRDSFEEIEKLHAMFTGELGNLPCHVIGTKADLEDDRAVTKGELEALGERLNATTWEVSAKTGQNVEELFDTVIEELIEKKR